ncbi:MAG TPA: mechanosensitive ion channel protein MscS [Lachnospiraceae bacterium]|nr:mechanosensitive ion channel protein MscS [Lachnospiraceae bacterium]
MFETTMLISLLSTAIPKLLYCLLIIIVCIIGTKISTKSITTIFNSRITKLKQIDAKKSSTLGAVISSVSKYTIIFIGVCSILIHLGVSPTTLAAVLGTGTVAIGLGAQSVIKDIIAGFFIILENQFGVGDIITIEGKTGSVEDITIRTTQLRGADGTLHIIPNGAISIVSNMCKEYINAIVDVDIAYEENLEAVLKILNNEMDIAAKELTDLRSRPTVLGVINLGNNGITIRTVAECDIKQNFVIERDLRLRIKNRLDKENISIPFPQCTVHMAEK